MKSIEIYLPEEDFDRLNRFQAIEQVPASSRKSSDSFGGLNRALSWITKCNCAILTGWRKDNTRAENDENNRTIVNVMRKYGYGVCKCRGCYPEGDSTVSAENSFFVFDYNETGSAFFDCVKTLSTQFEQDCFLFIEAGHGKRPYLYGTNDFFGIGRREYLGGLQLGAMESESFTKFGNKEVSFIPQT